MRTLGKLAGLGLFFVFALTLPAFAQEAQDAAKEIERLNALVAEQQKKIEELTRALGEAQELIKKLQAQKSQPEASPEPAPAEVSAPKTVKVSGKITHVKMENKSVLMDVGKSVGIKKDDVFTVSRAGRVLGKVKVCIVIDNFLSNADILENVDDFLPGDDVVLQTGAPGQAPTQPVKVVSAPEKPLSPETENLQKRLSRIEDALASLTERLEKLESAFKEHSEKTSAPLSPPVQKEETPSTPTSEAPKVQPTPSTVQAKVADVEGSVVYIWAGTNQGVKEGDIFAIKRAGKVIARVRIDQVEPETGGMCRGQIISKTANIDRKTDIAEKE
jgi:cell shape-determining protein MreC